MSVKYLTHIIIKHIANYKEYLVGQSGATGGPRDKIPEHLLGQLSLMGETSDHLLDQLSLTVHLEDQQRLSSKTPVHLVDQLILIGRTPVRPIRLVTG